MSKRPPTEASSGSPSAKKGKSSDAIDMGAVSGQEEFDIKLLHIRNKKLAERLKERHIRADKLQHQVFQLQKEKDARIKSAVTLKRYMDKLEKGIMSSACSAGVDMTTSGNLPEGNILKFSPSELEKFLQERQDVIVSLLSLLVSKIESGQEVGSSTVTESAVEFLQMLKDNTEKKLETERLSSEVEILEERVEDLTNQLEDSRHDEEKAERKIEGLLLKVEELKEELQKRPSAVLDTDEEEQKMDTKEETTEPEQKQQQHQSQQPQTTTDVEVDQDELSTALHLAESRLEEIKELEKSLLETKQKLEIAEMEKKSVPDAVVKETAVYKSLQSNFSIVFTENTQLRSYLEESKQLLVAVMSQHHNQFEEVKAEARKLQQEAKEEIGKYESSYLVAKKELEVMKVEHDKYVAANEQAVPQNKELRKTTSNLQKTIQQQKNDLARYKEKAVQAEQKLAKAREERNSEREREAANQSRDSQELAELREKVLKLQDANRKLQLQEQTKKPDDLEEGEEPDEDARGRQEILESERRAKQEVESMQERMNQTRREYERRKQQIREEAGQRQHSLVEENKQLQKDLSSKRQQEEGLMKEMEIMGQAFEDLQEQNLRLLDQLKEKDDANFKLMSERVKTNSLHKLVSEERDLLSLQLMSMVKERDLSKDALAKWEEKERSHEAAFVAMEKELSLERQAVEMHKKRAYESAQGTRDAQLKISELDSQLSEVRSKISEKTEECDRESNAAKRAQEEATLLRKKVDKYKNREQSSLGDEVLLEEIKMYKTKLNCPCCGTRKKDTVLTKCFHVFCSECIRTRYETRQRKCPKCNATFGFSDYHKIYLS